MGYDVGQTIGSYELLSVCGAGAYGKVFLAQNIMTRHRVALKILLMSDKIVERELQGLMNYRECRHPNLLQIHHIENINDYLYYTMDAADNVSANGEEYVPDTLANRLRQKKSLPAAEVNKMATELLCGLEYLHAHGLIHRDIKPDNILWVDGRATLADIGLTANAANASLVGTPGFMSEALLAGKRSASIEDDLYAMGKVIYCALTGCPVGEYPHYPGSITISDAGSLIKAYTAACQSPSPVKSSNDMKDMLARTSKSSCSAETRIDRRKTMICLRWAASTLLALVCVFVVGVWMTNKIDVKEHRTLVPPTEIIPPHVAPTVTKQANEIVLGEMRLIPANANIISDLELLYASRDSARMRAALSNADEAIRELEYQVAQKVSELNKRKMTVDTYRIAMDTIEMAKMEHLEKDPLCRLARKEQEINKFLNKHESGGTTADAETFKRLLNERDLLLTNYVDTGKTTSSRYNIKQECRLSQAQKGRR